MAKFHVFRKGPSMGEVFKLTRSSSVISKERSLSDGIPLFPNPNLPIGIFRTPQEVSLLHLHDFTEITIIESGHGMHRYKGANSIVQAGDVFVIQPDHPHQYTETNQLVVSNILFFPDSSIPLLQDMEQLPAYQAMFKLEPALRLAENTGGRLHLGIDKLSEIISVISKLEHALYHHDKTSPALATLCFLQLIRDLCDAYDERPPSMGASIMQVSKAISHIEEHFCDPINIGDLAKLSGMSLRSFQRHFQRATAMSAARYITHHRISEARRLLQAGASVTDTAFKVGFEDSNYFSHVFSESVGISPKRFQMSFLK